MSHIDFRNNIKSAMRALTDPQDYSWREDALAKRTGWKPLSFQYAMSNRTHCLKIREPDGALCFAPYVSLRSLRWPLLALAGAAAVVMLLSLGVEPFHRVFFGFPILYLPLLIVMAGAAVAGLALRNVKPMQIVFDISRQIFYKTRQSLSVDTDDAGLETAVPFADIGALQLLRIWSGNSNQDYYQLNLVRKNAKRVNVITEGGYEMLLDEAVSIARILQIPLWDDVNSPGVKIQEWPIEYAKE